VTHSSLQYLFNTTIATKQYSTNPRFRKFRRQFFHSSLSHILQSLKPGTTTHDVVRCCDGHFRRAIYRVGPSIADYPGQALLCYTSGMLRPIRCGTSCDQGAPDQNATPFFLCGGPGDAIDITNESDIANESDITDGGELELDIGNSSESDSDTQ
jgi:Plavaka transposase